MAEQVCDIPKLKTSRDLEQAIRRYKSGDFKGQELFCLWQAIREAALEQMAPERDLYAIAGEDSY